MIYLPVTILLFLLFLLLLPFVWLVITWEVVDVAVAKLGFSPGFALLLFAAVILGSAINIPLYERVSSISALPDFADLWIERFWGIPLRHVEQKTIIAVNVGGGMIPSLLAIYELTRSNPWYVLAVGTGVTIVSYFSAQIVPGIGIQMNALVAPLTAAMLSLLLTHGYGAAPIAFAGGVLGTLIGADLLHLAKIDRMTPGVLSIGGAGVFDGIALCGLFSLLLT